VDLVPDCWKIPGQEKEGLQGWKEKEEVTTTTCISFKCLLNDYNSNFAAI